MKKLNIAALIPARAGSKGLPRKNLLKIGDKTLIEITVQVANQSRYINHVIFSSDEQKYLDLAMSAGPCEAILRPEDLSNDTASSWDVVRHGVFALEAKTDIVTDIIVLLQPTTPLRTVSHVDKVIEKIITKKVDASMTVKKVSYPPEWMFYKDKGGTIYPILDPPRKIKRRQDSRPTFQPAGTAYAITRACLDKKDPMDTDKLICVEVPECEAVNIDEHQDYLVAKAIWENGQRKFF